MTADRLFSDAELEPVEVVRDWEGIGYWVGRCSKCKKQLSLSRSSIDEARRSGLAAVEGHRCAMPGELPDSF